MSFPVTATTSFQMSECGSIQDGEKKIGNVNNEEEPRLTMHQDLDSDKKFKRLLANRAAAQKSRCKKLQYVDDLENKHKELERQMKMLRSQVAMASEEHQRVTYEHRELSERIAAMQQHSLASQREYEATRAEVVRLKNHLIFPNRRFR